MLKLLSAPPTNDRSPRYMERALAAIHQANHAGHPITLIYASDGGRVGQYIRFPDAMEETVIGPIAANYPECSITTVEAFDDAPTSSTAYLQLSPEIFPILRHSQFEDSLNRNFADPINGILRAIKPDEELSCRIEIHVKPASHKRKRSAEYALRLLDREFFRQHHRLAHYYASHITRPRKWFFAWMLGLFAKRSAHPIRTTLDTTASRMHDREEILQAASNKVGGHLFEVSILIQVHAHSSKQSNAPARLHQIAGALGAFTKSHLATFQLKTSRGNVQPLKPKNSFLMAEDELATIFHPPTETVSAERMQMAEFRELEPPASFFSDEGDGVILGRVRYRDDHRLIGIDQEARRRHLYIVGATGTGKSTLLLNMIQQDMEAKRGLTLFDVHGDLAESVLRIIPKHRRNEVINFDAAGDSVLGFNPLACSDPKKVSLVSSGVVSAFKKLFDSWGPRLESLLRSAVFATVEQQGTLHDMLRLLTEKPYREQIILRIGDEVVRSFWINEFAGWNVQYRTEAVSSVTNKIMPFLTNRHLRAITSQHAKRTLDIRKVMDEGKVLVVNLSRGRLGQDNATLLGSLLLTSIEQTALTRADIPEDERTDHTLYLDEFQSLISPSTSIMLSESRKYRLSLVLSHQLTRQLDPATYHAVVGNCGSMVCFRVGLEDAVLLAPAMSKHPEQLLPADLCGLPNYTAYAKLLGSGGVPSGPCSISTLPVPQNPSHPRICRNPAIP